MYCELIAAVVAAVLSGICMGTANEAHKTGNPIAASIFDTCSVVFLMAAAAAAYMALSSLNPSP